MCPICFEKKVCEDCINNELTSLMFDDYSPVIDEERLKKINISSGEDAGDYSQYMD